MWLRFCFLSAFNERAVRSRLFRGTLKLMLMGTGLVDILRNILALFAFAVVLFLLGLWRFGYE